MDNPVPTYACFPVPDEDTFAVNEYSGPEDDRRRATIYDDLTEAEADEIVAFMERFADKRRA